MKYGFYTNISYENFPRLYESKENPGISYIVRNQSFAAQIEAMIEVYVILRRMYYLDPYNLNANNPLGTNPNISSDPSTSSNENENNETGNKTIISPYQDEKIPNFDDNEYGNRFGDVGA